jgi:uncharacterized protein DUF3303
VKFIGFWEYDLEDTDKVTEKFRKIMEEREKGTERYGKLVFGPYHIGGESKGFAIYETDDMNQLTNLMVYYVPELKLKFAPIHESSKVLELFLKSKK